MNEQRQQFTVIDGGLSKIQEGEKTMPGARVLATKSKNIKASKSPRKGYPKMTAELVGDLWSDYKVKDHNAVFYSRKGTEVASIKVDELMRYVGYIDDTKKGLVVKVSDKLSENTRNACHYYAHMATENPKIASSIDHVVTNATLKIQAEKIDYKRGREFLDRYM